MEKIYEKIALIYPPIDDCYHTDGVNDSPPLGLVSLQQYVKRQLSDDIKVDIFDGEHTTKNVIISKLQTNKYDIVGLQPMQASQFNSMEILDAAKSSGAITVMGGHHASQLAKELVMNTKSLDYIIKGDGEEALYGLIVDKDKSTVPNLVYKENDKVIFNKKKNTPIDEGAILLFDPKDLEQYRCNATHFERSDALSFRAYSHKGCENRANSQYCFFCGRHDQGTRFKSPEIFARELKYLREIGAKYVFEIGDDFLQNELWLKSLLKFEKEIFGNSDMQLKIFARANRINKESVDLIKKLRVSEVAIGFESGSKEILKRINKRATPEDNLRAATILAQAGIDTVASFVIGLPGEDDSTLDLTYKLAERVAELSEKFLGHKPPEVVGNLIEINPGSLAFKEIKKAFPEKYQGADIVPVKGAQDDYFRLNFDINNETDLGNLRNKFSEYVIRLSQLGRYTYTMGMSKDDFSRGAQLCVKTNQ